MSAVATPFTPPTASVANNAVSYIFDSTASFLSTPGSSAGSFRNRHPNTRIEGIVSCTDQDVTVRLDYWNGSSWVTSATTATATAGTPKAISWLPAATDWRVVTVNGATGPTALTFYGFKIIKGDRASGS